MRRDDHIAIAIIDGKGSKDRIVYMSNDVIQALTDYLKARPSVTIFTASSRNSFVYRPFGILPIFTPPSWFLT